MTELKYTLLADGPSDDALLPVLSWLLVRQLPETAIQPQWADLRKLPVRPRGLSECIRTALELFPCDVLFVHRDAEREPPEHRIHEIRLAVDGVDLPVPHLRVIPVRMTEAWLLFDAAAIRRAAGNPNGDMPLELPALSRVEDLPDPKEVLRSLLREASGLTGRRLKTLRVQVRRVADLIDDFSPLRHLSAFQRLEKDVHAFVQDQHQAVDDEQAQ
jgi:hypothetical protein